MDESLATVVLKHLLAVGEHVFVFLIEVGSLDPNATKIARTNTRYKKPAWVILSGDTAFGALLISLRAHSSEKKF